MKIKYDLRKLRNFLTRNRWRVVNMNDMRWVFVPPKELGLSDDYTLLIPESDKEKGFNIDIEGIISELWQIYNGNYTVQELTDLFSITSIPNETEESNQYEEVSISLAIDYLMKGDHIYTYVGNPAKYERVYKIEVATNQHEHHMFFGNVCYFLSSGRSLNTFKGNNYSSYKLYIKRRFIKVSLQYALDNISSGREKIFLEGKYDPVVSVFIYKGHATVASDRWGEADIPFNSLQFVKEVF